MEYIWFVIGMSVCTVMTMNNASACEVVLDEHEEITIEASAL